MILWTLVNCPVRFFADETSLFFKKRPSSEKLNSEIHSVSYWLNQNKMDLIELKTFVMSFFETKTNTNYQSCAVQKCNSCKYLRLFVDANLTFEAYV